MVLPDTAPYALHRRTLSVRSVAESVLELQREPSEELQACTERFLGAFDGDDLVGVVSWRRLVDETLDICRLAVAPSSQRRGWATRLLDALDEIEPAALATVSTRTANSPALELYRRRGFRPFGRREISVGITVTLLVRAQAAASSVSRPRRYAAHAGRERTARPGP